MGVLSYDAKGGDMMDQCMEVELEGEPAIQDLAQSEFDALCTALYLAMLQLADDSL